ncbi:thioesterase II family protein [Brucella gallinifaecis]|uniref:thioesterase II family protein n=1 Tax=Brucella gallinifaecis TaxID=215590 RepID=UPI002360FCC7|nr:alpha/beta fold hydrolase [Brucella gallinifaecis]
MDQNIFPHILRRPRPALRLFCLPYAGANAAYYRSWAPHLPDKVELWPVELPGRGTRFSEPLQPDMSLLVRDLAEAVAQHSDIPFVLFGHSMGSAITFALALELKMLGRFPAMIVCSGRSAPHRINIRNIHKLPDSGIIAEITRLGATPAEVLESAELMELILPIVRNDYTLIETYKPDPALRIESPMLVLCGRDDHDAPQENLEAWQDLTTGPMKLSLFDGDHFYLNDQKTAIISAIMQNLEAMRKAAA